MKNYLRSGSYTSILTGFVSRFYPCINTMILIDKP